MNIKEIMALINERIFITGVVLIACIAIWFSYNFYQEGGALNQKIITKQNELVRILELKDIYLKNKYKAERANLKRDDKQSFSLSYIEDVVSKTFISGKLTMLKPSTLKEQKGGGFPSLELKISNATLNEVVVFLGKVETSGLSIRKLYLTVPQNQPTIDVYAVITGR